MARLLHLIHSFPPETRGGIEAHLEHLAAAQAAAHEVSVVAGSNAERLSGRWDGNRDLRPEREQAGGVTVLRLPTETEIERFAAGGASANLARFERILDAERPDLLHVHHFAITGPGPVRLAAARGIPVVVSLHDLFTICPLFFRLRDERVLCAEDVTPQTCVECLAHSGGLRPDAVAGPFATRSAAFRDELTAAAAILPLSHSQSQYLRRVPLLAGLTLEPIGFPAAPAPTRGPLELRLPDLPLHVATWGGLVRGKGLHLLVEAATTLPPDSIELHHHGGIIDAAYRAEVEAAAGQVPLTFHGPYAPDDLARRLAHCDLAVHPSLFLETHGYTTDEALRLGLPVLVPDRGAPRERIGRRGRTFRVGDVEDLRRHLTEFVEHPERLLTLRAGEPGELLELREYRGRLDAIYDRARQAPH
ncbi:glycosyltransferase [Engelhardtia mirabilis]|uniref:Glycosyl transferases group 1 n=1 Tax=Engelhardtia mirabilis TaxID=2528011 RepID=A0A518BF96_9BACT|nr:Glycosyl transferases group 1 [Planctomycetes bacterium Pla133]QDU99980.1 Glycosyl transferases group 1 [Planctomycetes bacterium Pla86]